MEVILVTDDLFYITYSTQSVISCFQNAVCLFYFSLEIFITELFLKIMQFMIFIQYFFQRHRSIRHWRFDDRKNNPEINLLSKYTRLNTM